MNKSWNISRRKMLRGIGAMLALPPLEIMAKTTGGSAIGTTNAVGVAGSAPLRFLTVFVPNGVMPRDWDVKGVGKDYKISPILKPLDSLRDDMSIISGLDNESKGHVGMTTSFLTGVNLRNGKAAESLDMRIARHVGGDTKFRSLVLGTEPPRQGRASGEAISIASTVSWSSETARISPEINPRIAFDRMFRVQSGVSALKEAQLRKSVVDLVLEDAKNLHRKASYLDKEKLNEYLESVRSVERRLEKTLNPQDPDWVPPTRPTEADLVRPLAGIPRRRDAHLRLMIDLMVLGLWTDSTRVCTLMTAHGFSRQNFSFLDGVTDDHHSISHHKGIKKKTDQYTKVSTWYVEQFAYLLNRLKSIDEEGSSLLDNSAVLFGSGMKDGNGHVRGNLPIVLAGKAQGKLKTGSHIKLKKQPLSNLHLTLGQKFGIEANDFNGTRSRVISEL